MAIASPKILSISHYRTTLLFPPVLHIIPKVDGVGLPHSRHGFHALLSPHRRPPNRHRRRLPHRDLP
ncbi:unnamed protein product [Chondrus crispus]|uniref:Uncharacterized protein n=1 Tax=Chondrus crispus TaxID=2769 RepID=R7QD11_CHOCR|nr:unnamed protein product [Chondrus crispus]CDF36392.1 unnamed protein product [Chondrus crispus]|eukprot:XP_005716211.1 unnamed protein product [Chondrus crispus]